MVSTRIVDKAVVVVMVTHSFVRSQVTRGSRASFSRCRIRSGFALTPYTNTILGFVVAVAVSRVEVQ